MLKKTKEYTKFIPVERGLYIKRMKGCKTANLLINQIFVLDVRLCKILEDGAVLAAIVSC